MNRKGVCYDVGRVMMGREWRPVFDPRTVHRELEIIKNDVHCNAVRICGLDIERLMIATEDALTQGLEVWLSPEIWDQSQEETLDYIARVAASAEALGARWRNQLVLSVGSELTLFMHGILEGNNFLERIGNPISWETIRAGAHNQPLNGFLTKANAAVRQAFHGKVTYCSVPLETVDWSIFDFVCTDLYRDARIKDQYGDLIKRCLTQHKPVAITEFGCCTYRGAEDAGGMGWNIIDFSTMPPRLKGDYVYDQGTQAREVADQLRVIDHAGVDGAFVFTFVQPVPFKDEAEKQVFKQIKFDFDIANYSLVKSHIDKHGTTYPDMPWEPKESFHAVAEYYATH